MNFFIWFGFLAVCFGFTHGYEGDCGRCDPNAHCEVDKCVCLEGFKGNGTTCAKEMCSENTSCPADSRCVNETCVKQETMCKHCPQLSSCENVDKDCRCKSGFVLDGTSCLRKQAVAGGTFTEALLSMIKSDDRNSRDRNKLLTGFNPEYKMSARNKLTNSRHNTSRVTSLTLDDTVHCNPENRESICKKRNETKLANNETDILSITNNQTTNLNNTSLNESAPIESTNDTDNSFLNESVSIESPNEMDNTTVNTTNGITSEVIEKNEGSKDDDNNEPATLNNVTKTMPVPTSSPSTISPPAPTKATTTAIAEEANATTTAATTTMTKKIMNTTTKRMSKTTGFIPSYPTPKLPPAPPVSLHASPISLDASPLSIQVSSPANLSSEDHFLHEDVPKLMGMETALDPNLAQQEELFLHHDVPNMMGIKPTQNPNLPQLEVGPVEVVNENASKFNEDIPNMLPINSDDVAVHHHTINFTGPDSSPIMDGHEEVLNKSITIDPIATHTSSQPIAVEPAQPEAHPIATHIQSQTMAFEPPQPEAHPIATHVQSQPIVFEPPQPGVELHKRLSSHKTIHEQELFHPSTLFANPHPDDPSEVLIQSIPHKHNYQIHASSRNTLNDKRSSSKKHGTQKRGKFLKASHKT